MDPRSSFRLAVVWLCLGWCGWEPRLHAQLTPQFTGIQRLTNKEIYLSFTGTPGLYYRIDAATNLPDWSGLLTAFYGGAAPLRHTDSLAPFLPARYYRAQQVSSTGVFTGDHLVTTNGEAIIQPRYHATLVISWQSRAVYVDPDDSATYTGLPKADLVLLTHAHTDHLSTPTIDAVRGTNAVLIAPQDVYTRLTVSQQALTRVLGYGQSTSVWDMAVDAIPAYNSNHPYGLGNGYVLSIAGKRIYISGDTGNTSEMRALSGIDVAFLCMNLPYAMTAADATNAVSAFRPGVVYPYHYRDQSGATTNAAYFKQILSPELGVEVRLRKWY